MDRCFPADYRLAIQKRQRFETYCLCGGAIGIGLAYVLSFHTESALWHALAILLWVKAPVFFVCGLMGFLIRRSKAKRLADEFMEASERLRRGLIKPDEFGARMREIQSKYGYVNGSVRRPPLAPPRDLVGQGPLRE
jgi:hypothetical protein